MWTERMPSMKRLQGQEDLKFPIRIEKRLKEFGVCPGDTIVVGVSGGPDSVCLLHLLKTVSKRFPLRLHIAHLDHGLRGEESIADARFVERLADEWKIPVSIESISVTALARQKRISLQVAAREARYAYFQQIAEKLQSRWIALGHTADDQAETFLLRLLRGAGARGLSSIPPFREIRTAQRPQTYIIRPLLDVRRKEILSYLKTRSIPYREDSSNLKGLYLRNRLRQEVVPLLTSYNPSLIETLCRTAELLREEQDFLLAQAAQALSRLKVDQSGSGLALNRAEFLGLHRVLQRLVLREAMAKVKGDLVGVSYRHLEDVLSLISSGKTGKYLKMPGGICIRLVYDRIWISSLQGDAPRNAKERIEVSLSIPGEFDLPLLRVRVKVSLKDGYSQSDPRHCAAFDFSKIHPPFMIRSRMPGDYFFPTGMGGKRKKLQDFFVDHKIPQHERNRIPLLTASEGILWVMGWRLDGRFLASPDRGTVMVVEIKENYN
jgi:tRNA(Ile)-lysidine synthase